MENTENEESSTPKTPEQILNEMKVLQKRFQEMTENLNNILGNVNYGVLAEFTEVVSSFKPDKMDQFVEAVTTLERIDPENFWYSVQQLKNLDLDGIIAAASILKGFDMNNFAYAASDAAQAARILAELR